MGSALLLTPKAHPCSPAQQVPILILLLQPQPRSYVPVDMQQDTVRASVRLLSSHHRMGRGGTQTKDSKPCQEGDTARAPG